MDKGSLIKIISLEAGLKRSKCESIFNSVIKSISNDLKERKNVSIDNFGEFKLYRNRTRVIIKNNKKFVYPPNENIEFSLSENYPGKIPGQNNTKKTEIISEISIQFIMGIEESGKITDLIFNTLRDSFKKNKIVFIQKFGEFKNLNNNRVEFSPSKKLQKRINYSFSNLKTTEVNFTEEKFLKSDEEFEYSMSDEFIKKYKEICKSEEIVDDKIRETVQPGVKKKLISDELIKLHREIVSSEDTNKNIQ